MKFGKEFQHILEDSHFPEEWKSSAIEYRQLKKIIKDVVTELSSMGLSPDILHKLLVTEENTPAPRISELPAANVSSLHNREGDVQENAEEERHPDGDILEFEFESDEASPPTLLNGSTPMSTASMSPMRPIPSSSQAGSSRYSDARAVPNGNGDENRTSQRLPHSRGRTNPSNLGSSYTSSAGILQSGGAGSSSVLSKSVGKESSIPRQRRFRVRLLSESTPNSPSISRTHSPSPAGISGEGFAGGSSPRPMSVAGMMRDMGEPLAQDAIGSWEDESILGGERGHGFGKGRRVVRRSMATGAGAKAEYKLGEDASHPTPQLVLHLPATHPSIPISQNGSHIRTSSVSSSRSATISTDEDERDNEDEDDLPQPIEIPRSTRILRSATNSPATIKAFSLDPDSNVPDIELIPPSPSLQRIQTALSPIFALASGVNIENGMRNLTLGDSAVDEDDALDTLDMDVNGDPTAGTSPSSAVVNTNGDKDRDFVIPLASDQAFFNLLTAALTSLSSFHASQQVQFRQSVDRLCSMISRSIQPSLPSQSDLTVIATPLTPSPFDSTYNARPRAPQAALTPYRPKPNKKDLYVWREIFTLWIEAEIFESSAERSRGERTVEQAESRLQKFAAEVVKRGLGDRRTLKGKKTREAWEEFLRLNVLLLDLKRFQMANISAAKKILKKHDKRTALTASTGFQSFVRSTLSAVGTDGNITTWTFYNTSLPHVLLASLTDTLLPILPSLDDYACLICTSIAFKPIRLNCKHLFCVRCLVKMQKAQKAECPLCRSQVVLLADKNSLDRQVMQFMLEWFPKEVRDKERENDVEIAEELDAELGHQGHSCVLM